jgi:hypothetical protein
VAGQPLKPKYRWLSSLLWNKLRKLQPACRFLRNRNECNRRSTSCWQYVLLYGSGVQRKSWKFWLEWGDEIHAGSFAHSYADTDSNTKAFANAYSDSDSKAFTNANANSDSNTKAFTNAYANADSKAFTNAYADTDSNSDSNPDSNANSYTESESDRDTGSFADSHADTDSFANSDARSFSNANSNTKANPDSHADTDSFANSHARSFSNANADSNPNGHSHANHRRDGYADADAKEEISEGPSPSLANANSLITSLTADAAKRWPFWCLANRCRFC